MALTGIYNVLKESTAPTCRALFFPQDGGSTFLKNAVYF
jgi:hypothetical protein